jgi:hypothetical protein
MGSSPGFVSHVCNSRYFVSFPPFSDSLSLWLRLSLPSPYHSHELAGSFSKRHAVRLSRTVFLPPLALPLSVSERFQVLFHSPHRGSFHLSLTVLLRYRSSRVFSLGGWTPLLHTGLACPVLLRVPASSFCLRLRDFHPLRSAFPAPFRSASLAFCWPFYPACLSTRFGLLRFRSPLLAESFLFLRVLRCFTSPGSLPSRDVQLFTVRVSPFGHRRLSACTRLPGAFRSVPRPSSALDAQASPVRLLSLLFSCGDLTPLLSLALCSWLIALTREGWLFSSPSVFAICYRPYAIR